MPCKDRGAQPTNDYYHRVSMYMGARRARHKRCTHEAGSFPGGGYRKAMRVSFHQV